MCEWKLIVLPREFVRTCEYGERISLMCRVNTLDAMLVNSMNSITCLQGGTKCSLSLLTKDKPF